MRNRKGFTLVELLAVIAILAILVIIALPNVIRMFNEAKKSAFVIEAQTVYKETTKKFISELSKGNKLSTISSDDDTKLDMSGKELDYCVIMDNQGKVKKLAVGNDSYYIMLNDINNIESITNDDVQEGKLSNMKCDSAAFKVKLKCKYDGELKQGAEYINGQYTYRYMQESSNNRSWNNIYDLGWGVRITNDKSEEDANTAICDTINDIPIVSAAYMYYFSNAKQIDVSTLNTDNIKNMSYMFSDTVVEKLDLSNFNTSNVTNIRGMFDSSYVKEIIGISDFDTSNVTDMSFTFKWSSLETIDISRWDTSKVTSMAGMFSGASKASSGRDGSYRSYVDASVKNIIGLNDINTEKLVNMNYMFEGYRGNDFSLSNFDTSNVTKMGYTFSGIKVNKLDLSNLNTTNVTSMIGLFKTSEIENLTLTNLNTSKVTDMSYMFQNAKISEVDLSSFDTSKVTNMAYMFDMSYYGKVEKIIGLEKLNTSRVTNMSNMFYGCKAELTLDNFDTSKVTNMSSMFRRTNSSILNVSNFDTSNVTNMSEMFGSSNAKVIDVSNFNTKKLKSMNHMFYQSNAETIDMSSFYTKNITDLSGLFWGAKAKYINVSNFDTSNVTNMYHTFSYVKADEIVGLESFVTNNVVYMTSAFENCATPELYLTNFTFDNLKSWENIFKYVKATQKIYVKSANEQSWIINNAANDALTTSNVIIKNS